MSLVSLQYMLKYAKEKCLYSNANTWAKTSYVTRDVIIDQLGSVFICGCYHFLLFAVTSY